MKLKIILAIFFILAYILGLIGRYLYNDVLFYGAIIIQIIICLIMGVWVLFYEKNT